jgi:hypothetical protein
MQENKEYYTIEDLSKIFKVSQDLIIHFIKNGTIKAIGKGNQTLIPKKEFDKGSKGMLEYLLSNPINNDRKINPVNTFWIFSLGMGLGSWFVSGDLFSLIAGIIMGALIWFILSFLFGNLILKIFKWTKRNS